MKIPKPPADLWAQLDAIREQSGIIERPEHSFTLAEWADRYKVSRDSARCQVERLVQQGRVKRLGKGVKGTFYYSVVN